MAAKVVITGLDEVLRRLGLLDELKDGKLGTVFSSGAHGPSGRYEHYVQSAANQAKIHQGRWQTDNDIAAHTANKVVNEYRKLVRAIADGKRVSLKSATERALKVIYEAFRKYPPPPSNSRYTRTERLKESYRYEVKV